MKPVNRVIINDSRPKAKDVSQYLGGTGNISHLWEFIDYFEKKLEAEVAPYRNWLNSAYLKCPNFAAWIRIYAELICNKAMVELNRAEKCERQIKSYKYRPVIEKIIVIANQEKEKSGICEDIFIERVKAIKLVVELRHSLQHGGIPNIIRDMEFKEIPEEEIGKMIIPQCYIETKKIFQSANLLIGMLPRPSLTIYADAKVEFTDPTSKPRG